MGPSLSNMRTPIGPISFQKHLIDGRFGELGDIFLAENDAADLFFTHHFIFVKNYEWNHYKIYEWTKKGLKMYCCTKVKIQKKTYLGSAYVSDIYKIAVSISKGKDFSSISFNCKDWVERFQNYISIYLL